LPVGVCLMLWGWAAEPALAEERWLVIEVAVGGTGNAVAAGQVADSLRRQGQRVLVGREAASEFERVHSRSAVQLPPSQVKKLDDDFRTLADHLASEELAAAQPLFRRLAELPPGSRDFLNRDPARARRGFQICLLSGHMLSRLGKDAEGLRQVRRCAADYPGFQPEVGSYLPDSIRKFFDRALAELDSVPVATLRIYAASGQAGVCRARVNGIAAPGLPATVSGIRATDVRVQLDCGDRLGRIYSLKLKPGDNAIEIDPELEDAVTTDEQLGLRYADLEQAREHAPHHAARLGRVLGVDSILLLLGEELVRIEAAGDKQIAELSVDDGPLDELVARLVRGASPVPIARAVSRPEPTPPESEPPYRWLAFGSAGAAVVGAGVAVIAWRMREAVIHEHNADFECVFSKPPPARCDALLEKAATRRSWIVAGAIAGGGFAVLSVVFFVLDGAASDRPVAAVGRCGPGPGDLGIACGIRF
jgi:hypothetical protein